MIVGRFGVDHMTAGWVGSDAVHARELHACDRVLHRDHCTRGSSYVGARASGHGRRARAPGSAWLARSGVHGALRSRLPDLQAPPRSALFICAVGCDRGRSRWSGIIQYRQLLILVAAAIFQIFDAVGIIYNGGAPRVRVTRSSPGVVTVALQLGVLGGRRRVADDRVVFPEPGVGRPLDCGAWSTSLALGVTLALSVSNGRLVAFEAAWLKGADQAKAGMRSVPLHAGTECRAGAVRGRARGPDKDRPGSTERMKRTDPLLWRLPAGYHGTVRPGEPPSGSGLPLAWSIGATHPGTFLFAGHMEFNE